MQSIPEAPTIWLAVVPTGSDRDRTASDRDTRHYLRPTTSPAAHRGDLGSSDRRARHAGHVRESAKYRPATVDEAVRADVRPAPLRAGSGWMPKKQAAKKRRIDRCRERSVTSSATLFPINRGSPASFESALPWRLSFITSHRHLGDFDGSGRQRPML